MFKSIIKSIKKSKSKSSRHEQDAECSSNSDPSTVLYHKYSENDSLTATNSSSKYSKGNHFDFANKNVGYNTPNTRLPEPRLRSSRNISGNVDNAGSKIRRPYALSEADSKYSVKPTKWLSALRFHPGNDEEDAELYPDGFCGSISQRPVRCTSVMEGKSTDQNLVKLNIREVSQTERQQDGFSEDRLKFSMQDNNKIITSKSHSSKHNRSQRTYENGHCIFQENRPLLLEDYVQLPQNQNQLSATDKFHLHDSHLHNSDPLLNTDNTLSIVINNSRDEVHPTDISFSATESELYLLSSSFINDSCCTYVSMFDHKTSRSNSLPTGDVMIEEDYVPAFSSTLETDCNNSKLKNIILEETPTIKSSEDFVLKRLSMERTISMPNFKSKAKCIDNLDHQAETPISFRLDGFHLGHENLSYNSSVESFPMLILKEEDSVISSDEMSEKSSVLTYEDLFDAEKQLVPEYDHETSSQTDIFSVWKRHEETLEKLDVPVTNQTTVSEIIEYVLSTNSAVEDRELFSLVTIKDLKGESSKHRLQSNVTVDDITKAFSGRDGWHFELNRCKGIKTQIILCLPASRIPDHAVPETSCLTISTSTLCKDLISLAAHVFNLNNCLQEHSCLVLLQNGTNKMVNENEIVANLSTDCFILCDEETLNNNSLNALKNQHLEDNADEGNFWNDNKSPTPSCSFQDANIKPMQSAEGEINNFTTEPSQCISDASVDSLLQTIAEKDCLIASLEQENMELKQRLTKVCEPICKEGSTIYDALANNQDTYSIVSLVMTNKVDDSLAFMIGISGENHPIVKRCEPGIPLEKGDVFVEINGIPVFGTGEKELYGILTKHKSSEMRIVVMRKKKSEASGDSSEVQSLRDDLSLMMMELEIAQHENKDLNIEVNELKESLERSESKRHMIEVEFEELSTAAKEHKSTQNLIENTLFSSENPEEILTKLQQLFANDGSLKLP